jgi:hypothetical protein
MRNRQASPRADFVQCAEERIAIIQPFHGLGWRGNLGIAGLVAKGRAQGILDQRREWFAAPTGLRLRLPQYRFVDFDGCLHRFNVQVSVVPVNLRKLRDLTANSR